MRSPRSNKKGPSKSSRIRNWFDANPGRADEYSLREIAEATGTTRGLVAAVKASLGLTRPYARTPRAKPAPVDPVEQLVSAPEVKQIETSDTLSTEEKRRLLSELARNLDVRTEGRIAAINALHKIDESVGKGRSLGPGPPLTEAARIQRLGLLIAACGPSVHEAALRLARKEWDAEIPADQATA